MKQLQNLKNEIPGLKVKATPKTKSGETARKKTIVKSGSIRKQAHSTSRNRRNQAKKDSKG